MYLLRISSYQDRFFILEQNCFNHFLVIDLNGYFDRCEFYFWWNKRGKRFCISSFLAVPYLDLLWKAIIYIFGYSRNLLFNEKSTDLFSVFQEMLLCLWVFSSFPLPSKKKRKYVYVTVININFISRSNNCDKFYPRVNHSRSTHERNFCADVISAY